MTLPLSISGPEYSYLAYSTMNSKAVYDELGGLLEQFRLLKAHQVEWCDTLRERIRPEYYPLSFYQLFKLTVLDRLALASELAPTKAGTREVSHQLLEEFPTAIALSRQAHRNPNIDGTRALFSQIRECFQPLQGLLGTAAISDAEWEIWEQIVANPELWDASLSYLFEDELQTRETSHPIRRLFLPQIPSIYPVSRYDSTHRIEEILKSIEIVKADAIAGIEQLEAVTQKTLDAYGGGDAQAQAWKKEYLAKAAVLRELICDFDLKKAVDPSYTSKVCSDINGAKVALGGYRKDFRDQLISDKKDDRPLYTQIKKAHIKLEAFEDANVVLALDPLCRLLEIMDDDSSGRHIKQIARYIHSIQLSDLPPRSAQELMDDWVPASSQQQKGKQRHRQQSGKKKGAGKIKGAGSRSKKAPRKSGAQGKTNNRIGLLTAATKGPKRSTSASPIANERTTQEPLVSELSELEEANSPAGASASAKGDNTPASVESASSLFEQLRNVAKDLHLDLSHRKNRTNSKQTILLRQALMHIEGFETAFQQLAETPSGDSSVPTLCTRALEEGYLALEQLGKFRRLESNAPVDLQTHGLVQIFLSQDGPELPLEIDPMLFADLERASNLVRYPFEYVEHHFSTLDSRFEAPFLYDLHLALTTSDRESFEQLQTNLSPVLEAIGRAICTLRPVVETKLPSKQLGVETSPQLRDRQRSADLSHFQQLDAAFAQITQHLKLADASPRKIASIEQCRYYLRTLQQELEGVHETTLPSAFALHLRRCVEYVTLLMGTVQKASIRERKGEWPWNVASSRQLDSMLSSSDSEEPANDEERQHLLEQFAHSNSTCRYPFQKDKIQGLLHKLVLNAETLVRYPERDGVGSSDDTWSVVGQSVDAHLLEEADTLDSEALVGTLDDSVNRAISYMNDRVLPKLRGYLT